MKRTILDLLLCARCRGALCLETFRRDRVSVNGRTVEEITEGALHCASCSAAFPIVAGVPRLLSPALLAHVRTRHPRFFTEHPEFEVAEPAGDEPLRDTLESFTRQRLDFELPGPEHAAQWRANLERNLGDALPLHRLQGRLVLDVGCGFGRHIHVARECGAEVLGVDLSGGVDVAYRHAMGRWQCHVVQANLFDRPLRDGAFDVVWSFGVLHHMPDPAAGFRALVPFARQDGGMVALWVYGYRGMAFTYRLSHMRSLHAITRTLSVAGRLRASRAVAAMLSAFYWEPLRAARRFGAAGLTDRLPLLDYVDHSWSARVAAVHDRLSTPTTHFHDRDELLEWFRAAHLVDVSVEDTDRRGWRAFGRRTT
jgi:SAM-dependent methyltransferase